MDLTQNNISTIAVFIYTALQPILSQYGITQDIFLAIIDLVVGLILVIWSAYHPNTLAILDNAPEEGA